MHHISLRQGLRSSFEHAPDGFPAHAAQAGLLAGGLFELRDRPALSALGRVRARQRGHPGLVICVVPARPARARDVEDRQLHAALHIRRPGTPHRRSSHPKHGHDLRLRHAAIQAGQHMRSVHLSRVMNTLAANLVDERAIRAGQVQFRLTHDHTPLRRMPMYGVYVCFVTYVSPY